MSQNPQSSCKIQLYVQKTSNETYEVRQKDGISVSNWLIMSRCIKIKKSIEIKKCLKLLFQSFTKANKVDP